MKYPATHLLRKATSMVVSGVIGAAIVRSLEGKTGPQARRAAVEATKAGLKTARAAEVGIERARLSGGDIVAQARNEMGEQAPPPTSSGGHSDHDHDHDH